MDGRNRIHLREIQLGGRSSQSQIPLLPTPLIDHHHHNNNHNHHHQQDFHPHPALIEEQLHHQQREIQTLLTDNQRLAATHVALKQEVSASKDEIRHISTVATQVKAERDVEIRSLHQRSIQLESEVNSIGKFTAELAQAKVDIQKLSTNKLELTSKLQTINGDLVRVRQEREESKSVESDIDAMRIEVQKGRAAIEFEKKAHAENLEHKQLLEKNMNELTQAVEKLRSELADAEKRAQIANADAEKRAQAASAANASVMAAANASVMQAANASMMAAANASMMAAANASVMVAPNPVPVYAGSYGNPQMGYVGAGPSYVDAYSMHHMVQPNFGAGFQYGSAAVVYPPYAPYGVQQNQAPR